MKKNTEVLSSLCDCCGKQLTKRQTQRHHLIPKLLRNCNADNKKQVDICAGCHLMFHKLVNFADVIGYTKQYYIKEYALFKAKYAEEKRLFNKYLNRKDKEDGKAD